MTDTQFEAYQQDLNNGIRYEHTVLGSEVLPTHSRRFRLEQCRTRFNTIEWFLYDAEVYDDVTEGPDVVRQTDTREECLSYVASIPDVDWGV
jgi:hypothetical protein